MGLDDFTGDSPPDEELVEELSMNTPPSGASSWVSHEPEPPDWITYIGSEVRDRDSINIDALEFGVDDIKSDSVLCIQVNSVKSSMVRSGSYVELGDMV